VHGYLPTRRSSTVRAARRIVALYDAWGKPDRAAEWRARS